MSATVAGSLTGEDVLQALGSVVDPELDEPITDLGFVTSCTVTPEGQVEVVLRLPTPQCAPNFAFLMAAEAREALGRLPGVRGVRVKLADHYTGAEINSALERGLGFTAAFPGETDDDRLAGLRELFERKALLARQARLCRELLGRGLSEREVAALRVAELPDSPDARRCLQLRARLGLPRHAEAPAFLLADGRPLPAGELPRFLRVGRLVATSLEANGSLCRSLLAVRHARPPIEEEANEEIEEVAR